MAHKLAYLGLLLILLSGCSREFPPIPWMPADDGRRLALQEKTDFASRLELGRLEFLHNGIDEADRLLTPLVHEQPNNLEAKAWHAANRCKLAERRGPWMLGLDKVVLLWSCLTELERAGHHAGDNLSVALAQIYTDTEVSVFGTRHRAYQARDRLQQRLEAKPQSYAPADQASFYEAVAALEARYDNATGARDYLSRVIALNADADSVERARQKLRALEADAGR
ncbi:hypothetical protein [Methylococcus sp. EFPC2]|uniref:hypothetical protein n=1 Tax=Methylococcus sp. EFPC2 TaxID=2812648 RepID=UPI001966EBE5|nr:hypothetical protein [Methylococcus sp. EFPC2]QSA98899.1 hypothetical protein JWZ97_09045 [Methylococcus sp. EFPC2]